MNVNIPLYENKDKILCLIFERKNRLKTNRQLYSFIVINTYNSYFLYDDKRIGRIAITLSSIINFIH